MTSIALPFGALEPRIAPIKMTSRWIPTRFGIEVVRDDLDRRHMKFADRLFRLPFLDRILAMAGSDGNWMSAGIANLTDGGTAFSGLPASGATWYIGLWAAALDDTMTGATASECAYTSYARLALTNNTTIFASGSGTTTYTKTWPSDAAKTWATSTGVGTNNTATYMAKLNGNAGTTADKCGCWASITSVTINSGDTPQLAQNAVSQVRD